MQTAQVNWVTIKSQKEAAVTSLKTARDKLKKAESAALSVPAFLLDLESQIQELNNTNIPQLQQTVLTLKKNASDSDLTAKLAVAAAQAAQRMVMIADQKAAEAEKAWQDAEDRVDDLLGEHNTLLSQISAMAEFFTSHAEGSASNATDPAAATAAEQQRIKQNLEYLGSELMQSQSEVFSIQGAQQDSAAALAEQRLAAAQQAANAAAAAAHFQTTAADLGAAKSSVDRMQEQLQAAKQKHDSAAAQLAQQQAELQAAAQQLQGKQELLVNATAAANATQAEHQLALAALSTAVNYNLEAQKSLSAAMAELQNTKATEGSIMTDVTGSKEQSMKLEGQLASAATTLASAQVCYIGRASSIQH